MRLSRIDVRATSLNDVAPVFEFDLEPGQVIVDIHRYPLDPPASESIEWIAHIDVVEEVR